MSESVRRVTFVLVAVGALSALLSGCGGAEKAAHPLSDADLRSIVMVTPTGLPWTLALASDEAKSNERAAVDFPDSEQWLSNFERWGRTGGHAVSFNTGREDVFAVQTEVESYSSVGGAESAWAALRDFAVSGEFQRFLEKNSTSNVTVEEVVAAPVGDESIAYSMRTAAGGPVSETLVVLFRRGAVVASASVGAVPDEARIDAAVAVAQQMDGRIQNSLSR